MLPKIKTNKKDTVSVKKLTRTPKKKSTKSISRSAADAAKHVVSEPLEREEEQLRVGDTGGTYLSAVGRRKTAIARVRVIKNGEGRITINGRNLDMYFPTHDLRQQIVVPLKLTGQETAVDVSVKVSGGGIRGQADAVRHGISRALIQLNPTFRGALKKLGYLSRDARKRERKKFGLKSARRAPQWSKR